MTPADLENLATYLRGLNDMAVDQGVWLDERARFTVGTGDDSYVLYVEWSEDRDSYVMVPE